MLLGEQDRGQQVREDNASRYIVRPMAPIYLFLSALPSANRQPFNVAQLSATPQTMALEASILDQSPFPILTTFIGSASKNHISPQYRSQSSDSARQMRPPHPTLACEREC
jgi:hypothetical protein